MTDLIGDAIADPDLVTDPAAYDALFTQLRREEPIRWTVPSHTHPFWTVARHAAIMEVERQPEIFLSGPRLELHTIEEEEQIRQVNGGRTEATRTMLHMDGEEHRIYRGISQRWFMPNNLKALQSQLGDLAKEYVDRFAAHDGKADFVKDLAVWYPLRVIMLILGQPAEDEPKLLQLTQNYAGHASIPLAPGETRGEVLTRAVSDVFAYFGKVYEDRQRQPTDDLASIIAHANIKGKPIEGLEALSYYLLIGLAGHETTSSTIAAGMLALIDNPAEREKLNNNPELLSSAVDEMLRWATPAKSFMRTAAQDYELGGHTIKAGQSLLMCYASANRDEEVFEDPFEFRIDRRRNAQISFGYGPHLCLGQHLAKMEIKALFAELLPRLESMERDGPLAWSASTTASGLISMPVRYKMRDAVAGSVG